MKFHYNVGDDAEKPVLVLCGLVGDGVFPYKRISRSALYKELVCAVAHGSGDWEAHAAAGSSICLASNNNSKAIGRWVGIYQRDKTTVCSPGDQSSLERQGFTHET